ncbi:hypothetical protein [Blastococcus sp. TF02A-30]|uniref:hypothetical protein n=1 Tax=Blastococcus sp. TF02A-30 TaxID=2250580 RepID=UPI001314E789|nr:hypothetical protein [Blastococcus sp. TF02A-30]
MADLRREALANCCAHLIARVSLGTRLAAATGRLTAALSRSRQAAAACCAPTACRPA